MSTYPYPYVDVDTLTLSLGLAVSLCLSLSRSLLSVCLASVCLRTCTTGCMYMEKRVFACRACGVCIGARY